MREFKDLEKIASKSMLNYIRKMDTLEKVYNFLMEEKNISFRAKDIALALFGDERKYHSVVHQLQWLVNMGLIKREEIKDEPITIKLPIEKYIPPTDDNLDKISLNGCLYIRVTFPKGHWETIGEEEITIYPKYAIFYAV